MAKNKLVALKKANRDKLNPEHVIAALKASRGAVYLAAKALSISPTTIYKYVKDHKEVREALKTARGELLDVAEGKLWEAVEAKEAWAICFLLKTQGKHRGYVERAEIANPKGQTFKVYVTDGKFQPDEA